jgi:hypothetical protein
MELVRKGNATIINKFLDKLLANMSPIQPEQPLQNGASDFYKRFIDAIHPTAN